MAVSASFVGWGEEPVDWKESPTGQLDERDDFAELDASSPEFCLRFFEHILARTKQLCGETSWSMVEVIGSKRERASLRAWGRVGIADPKWLRTRVVTFEHEQFPGKIALALLFLAYSAEIVRSESSEGEMWPHIRQSLREQLAAEFFFSSGLAKPWLREATELVCRRLHIRHAFGQEGEQGWPTCWVR